MTAAPTFPAETGKAVGADVEGKVTTFLYFEAELLDDGRFEDWLELFTADATYEAPLRVTRERDASSELSRSGRIFSDTRDTLAIRVQRLCSGYDWAEQPPSRTRHYVTNVRVSQADDGSLLARANLLVFRSRGDDPRFDLYSADRRDVLVAEGSTGFRIKRRWLGVDQSNMTGNSLSVFL